MDQLFSADDAHPTFVQEDHVYAFLSLSFYLIACSMCAGFRNGISDAPALCRKIAGVIADMKPDVIAIEEVPLSSLVTL